MSDSESSSTASSSSEYLSSEEDIGEQSSITRAYQDEPLARDQDADDGGDEVDEDGIQRATLEARFEGDIPVDEWCQCGRCSNANLACSREFRCCMEMPVCIGKFTFVGRKPECIVSHEDYHTLSSKIVLEMVGPLLQSKEGKRYRKQQAENEYLRAVAYRWLVRWICGALGWDNARPLSACIYEDVRTRFASAAVKTGYKSAEQRN